MRWMRCLAAVSLAAAAACVGDSSTVDGGADGTADVFTGDAIADVNADVADAVAPACDTTKPFGAPMLVGGAVNSLQNDDGFWMSPDQLTVFVSSSRPLDGGFGADNIYAGTRLSLDASFQTLTPQKTLDAVGAGLGSSGPTLTSDGLAIFFSNGGPGGYDTWTATRQSVATDFPSPSLLPQPVNVNDGGAGEDNVSWVSADATHLYFMSTRGGSRDIYLAARTTVTAPFQTPTPVAELNTSSDEECAVFSADELQVFFFRTGSAGGPMYAKRTSTTPFEVPSLVNELKSSAVVCPLWVTPDGCTLYYFTSGGDAGVGGQDIYSATRGK